MGVGEPPESSDRERWYIGDSESSSSSSSLRQGDTGGLQWGLGAGLCSVGLLIRPGRSSSAGLGSGLGDKLRSGGGSVVQTPGCSTGLGGGSGAVGGGPVRSSSSAVEGGSGLDFKTGTGSGSGGGLSRSWLGSGSGSRSGFVLDFLLEVDRLRPAARTSLGSVSTEFRIRFLHKNRL